MRKILFIAVLAILCSCSSYGPSNKYFGHIPTIQVEEAKAYEEFASKDHDQSWSKSGGVKYKELMDKEYDGLKGVTMPCISGNPEVFKVLGDVAVFFNGMYHVLLEFEEDIIFKGDPTFYVNFCNSDEQKAYGQTLQIMFRRNVMQNGLNRRIGIYEKSDNRVQSFAINQINTNDYQALQEKTNLAVIFMKEDDYYLNKDGIESEYYFPETDAVFYQLRLYLAASDNDVDAFLDADGAFAEENYETESEQTYFNQAYNLWKIAFPEKWKTVKEFRKKLIADGNALIITDVDDPIF